MSGPTPAMTSPIGVNTSAFWERLWRTSGVQFIALCVIAYLIYGNQPPVGASPDALAAFYHDHHSRILIAAVIFGLAVLYLMWFAAAIRVSLGDAGKDGWGAAATSSSAAVGALFLLLAAVNAGLAYSIDGLGNQTLLPGLNVLAWAAFVMSSFVRAMLIMSAAFGFWRAGLISNALRGWSRSRCSRVLGGATWASGGTPAPDGAYSRFISPIIGLLWAMVVSWVLSTRTPSARAGW